jgi:hypothetical protein
LTSHFPLFSLKLIDSDQFKGHNTQENSLVFDDALPNLPAELARRSSNILRKRNRLPTFLQEADLCIL